MNWKLIKKGIKEVPVKGTYSNWKAELAEEGHHQCVYCSISDSRFGGQRNFHVEHFRPKSLFPDLENIFSNLFYSCPICNVFKGNDWYETDDLSTIHYPNPSQRDYSDLFELDKLTAEINGKYTASKYLVYKLALNRVQLILDRRLCLFMKQVESIQYILGEQAKSLVNVPNTGDEEVKKYLYSIIECLTRINTIYKNIMEVSPYSKDDTKRP